MAVHAIDHPLLRHKLGYLRDATTGSKLFAELAAEVAGLLAYEACRDLELAPTTVDTWIGPLEVDRLGRRQITVAPVLRAGLGMLHGVLDVLPNVSTSFIGLRRDEETLEPEAYYENLAPSVPGSTVLLLDPMLATGGTAVAALDLLLRAEPRAVKALFLVAAPEGIEVVTSAHPECDLYVAAMDERLNDNGFILPGLGDAGDRVFGTQS
jgi:uracil phosphoribosyltransferase